MGELSGGARNFPTAAIFAPHCRASLCRAKKNTTRPDTRMLKTSPRARDLMSLVSQFLPGQGKAAAPAAAMMPQALPGPAPAPARTALRPVPAPSAPDARAPEDAETPLPLPLCAKPEDPAAAQAQDRGQFLARQERWEELSGLIRAADMAREAARGALPLADLIAYGARADVVGAAEEVLSGDAAAGRGLIRGVMEFEALRAGLCRDAYLTALVALAHVDIAWAWRSRGSSGKRSCAAHFARAETLLAPFADSTPAQDSPFLQAAFCALLAGRAAAPATASEAEERYGQLIALDPRNPRPMRALGAQLLPRGGGSYDMLDEAARRTADATESAWGAGGYTWVWFDALALDPAACAHVDAELFLEGLRGILHTDPSQEMVNLIAAYCTVALPAGAGQAGTAQRLRISGAAHWLVSRHLTELHPLVWAHAAEGFDNSARVRSVPRFAGRGEAIARNALADLLGGDAALDARGAVTAHTRAH